MAAVYLGTRGFLLATVRQASNRFVPFRTATREFHCSCRVWGKSQGQLQYEREINEYTKSIPLSIRNPTKIVTVMWILTIPLAITAFFLTKRHIEKKRLRLMKLHRKRNESSQTQ